MPEKRQSTSSLHNVVHNQHMLILHIPIMNHDLRKRARANGGWGGGVGGLSCPAEPLRLGLYPVWARV